MSGVVFLSSVRIILVVTICLKVVTFIHGSAILAATDPVLAPLKSAYSMMFAVVLEAALLFILSMKVARATKFVSVLWLGLLFLLYRVGLWASGGLKYCLCLGSLTEWIGLSHSQANVLSLVTLAYIIAGSAFYYLAEVNPKQQGTTPTSGHRQMAP